MEDFETIELTQEELESIEVNNPNVKPFDGKQIRKIFDGGWIVLTYEKELEEGNYDISIKRVIINPPQK